MIMKYTVFLLLVCYCHCDNKPHVKTPLGEVQGSVKTSLSGRKFAAFEGIPFAKPPIGNRRFEEPEPVEPWTGVWNANFTTTCVQSVLLPMWSSQIDEDCLHVNVFVPLEKLNSNEKLEVIVHIHGGAYMYGAGHMYSHPDLFMDHDVVFVTFNYRLGILGFLSTQDEVVPGNNAFKDQVLALKWVQQNIASFGGNPDSVTLTGLSAGGSSVHMHYFSELSRGLFHRGFSQSGAALNSFTLQEKPLEKAKILAKGVGCPTSCNKEMVKCLKQRPWQHLLAQLPHFYGFKTTPVAPFTAVVEPKSSKKPFLTEDPYLLLTKGKVYDVPWISSNTKHEGTVILLFANNDIKDINEKWENVAPYLLDYQDTLPKSQWKEAARKIKDFYLGKNQEINSEENYEKTITMFGDRIFTTDAENSVRWQSKVVKSPIYYYYFQYPGDNNPTNIVDHGADGKYFFGDIYERKPLTTDETMMKDIMMEMLLSYAKTNKPTIPGVNWKPTKDDQLTYLEINSPKDIQLKIVENLTPRAFWSSLGLRENENLLSEKDEL